MNYSEMISDVKVYGMDESIRASKYPMAVDVNKCTSDITKRTHALANAPSGSAHDCWLKGVSVQFDLKMTVKLSTELQRYHFIDFISSQSTMHKITNFNLDEAYIEYVDKRVIDIMKKKVAEYNALTDAVKNSELGKEMYLEILYTNPCGMQLTARMTTNYLQLKTMYFQRRCHRLPEWQAFCRWIESLPNSEFITGERKEE